MNIPFENSYVSLPSEFYTRIDPTPVRQAELIQYNENLGDALGISGVTPDVQDANDALDAFAGNKTPRGAEPLAMVYAGHQFGGFSSQLGDGRAVLLGEVIGKDGIRYDIQLKGSGRTPYSRGGDGRSALGPVLREYLVSEAMAKLGVPTTRALAVVTTGEEVARDSLVPGGILTRVAKGFVRVGTFEYFLSQSNLEAIQQLADYEIERHYPKAKEADNPYVAFFAEVVASQAKLIAQWMGLGFIHGVMNTDNMSIAGETIDYGPCAFMDEFEHNRVYSSIDQQGRYAYSNQPQIGQWNLVRLAEAVLPLFFDKSLEGDEQVEASVKVAQDILNSYEGQYQAYWLRTFCNKLGLFKPQDGDASLATELLDIMEKSRADFTLTFHYLSHCERKLSDADEKLHALFSHSEALLAWMEKWRDRLSDESLSDAQRMKEMQAVNPVYIPRNHQVEAAIRAAEDHHDFSVFNTLHDVLQNPFTAQEGKGRYMLPPLPEEVVHQTFCGT